MKLEKHVHVLKREQKLLEMHLLNQPNFRRTQKELGNDFNQINWMKRKGHFWELCELWNQKFHWNLPPKTSMNESCKQRANLWKILIEGFKMSHPVLPGSPPLPQKWLGTFLCCVPVFSFYRSAVGRGSFLFYSNDDICTGKFHYQSSLERKEAALEQTAGCRPPRVTSIIHQL